MSYLIVFAAVFFNVLTNIGFKLAERNEAVPSKKWGYFSVGLVFGLINSLLFTEALKYFKLQVVSAVFFSATILGLFLADYFIFDEPLTKTTFLGGAIILTGVVVIFWK